MEDARIRADAAAVVRLGGDLGVARASEVRAQLHEVVEPLTPPTSLVVDLSEVSTVDAAGTRLLTELGAHCQARGVRLCLICSPDSPAYQACTAAGLAITDALSGTQPAAGTTATAFSTLTEALMRAHTVGEVLQRIVDATGVALPARPDRGTAHRGAHRSGGRATRPGAEPPPRGAGLGRGRTGRTRVRHLPRPARRRALAALGPDACPAR
ncbi:STAS domain-containing protein [Amycolatopsis sp. 195334CR]|uniref:STAS domain-containing protein n=1 Tax=Amycolatopsis sp. 195334CR TaxID=2814588 RepID=UPI001A8FF1E4|nr:STAS domain-containing protein [Amycolatopsis sp. 195334CR]MBN6038404.1 STAS domain-containing protein [Amycolatopsis sp. 195334CR]